PPATCLSRMSASRSRSAFASAKPFSTDWASASVLISCALIAARARTACAAASRASAAAAWSWPMMYSCDRTRVSYGDGGVGSPVAVSTWPLGWVLCTAASAAARIRFSDETRSSTTGPMIAANAEMSATRTAASPAEKVAMTDAIATGSAARRERQLVRELDAVTRREVDRAEHRTVEHGAAARRGLAEDAVLGDRGRAAVDRVRADRLIHVRRAGLNSRRTGAVRVVLSRQLGRQGSLRRGLSGRA